MVFWALTNTGHKSACRPAELVDQVQADNMDLKNGPSSTSVCL